MTDIRNLTGPHEVDEFFAKHDMSILTEWELRRLMVKLASAQFYFSMDGFITLVRDEMNSRQNDAQHRSVKNLTQLAILISLVTAYIGFKQAEIAHEALKAQTIAVSMEFNKARIDETLGRMEIMANDLRVGYSPAPLYIRKNELYSPRSLETLFEVR